ncbi:protein of unknown function (Single-strand binding (SSB) domain) [endosymbiont DhMRE of Dentiscutata heterogama]|uniref:hypothetical protein n=1 Tax=endosymbiont DhMRE of Dentiscutata heterogama TaxID=1609546 RepID=UPI000629DBA8|nr:hypothetical protein [endosymbiont DhMRE of Dentiscutata heterogama]CFW92927.1 protein of unknown function (Single-strand binding (SSB) domain) [endosymbiont DhMRE of Dentiscutata heterogama]
MLNKVKIIGKIRSKEFEKLNEKKVDDAAAVAPEAIPKTDESPAEEPTEAKKPEPKFPKKKREPWFYFNLFAPVPSSSLTILRCITQGEIAARINEEVQEEEDVIEVRGYLRNEKNSRQILVRVTEFTKLDISFSKINIQNSNQVRLLGKVLSDLQPVEKRNPEVLSFKLAVPREGVKSPLFFCRINEEELMSEFCEKLQRNDIILLEGFLQTQKIVWGEEGEKKIIRISSIICSGFTLLDSDLVDIFRPLDNLTRVVKSIRKIDFSKPKTKTAADEPVE